MKKYQIFIDGQAGTTGLQIRQRLASHPQIEVVTIDHDKRRDVQAKLELMRSVDVTVLCLPDDAAKETAPRPVKSAAGCWTPAPRTVPPVTGCSAWLNWPRANAKPSPRPPR